MSELRECPFCGGEDHIVGKDFENLRFTIMCSNCGLQMFDIREKNLIETWNTRHTPKHETEEQYERFIVRWKFPLDLNTREYYIECKDEEEAKDTFIANHHKTAYLLGITNMKHVFYNPHKPEDV